MEVRPRTAYHLLAFLRQNLLAGERRQKRLESLGRLFAGCCRHGLLQGVLAFYEAIAGLLNISPQDDTAATTQRRVAAVG